MSNAPPAQRFRDNCVALTKYCASLVEAANKEGLTPLDPVYIRAGVMYLEHGCSPDEMIEEFINYSHDYWSQIQSKDEKFFHENVKKVFPTLDTNVVDLFRSLFETRRPNGTPLISQSEKDYIWKIFQSLVKISIHHISEARQPYATGESVAWRDEYQYTQVTNLPDLIDTWGIRKNLRI